MEKPTTGNTQTFSPKAGRWLIILAVVLAVLICIIYVDNSQKHKAAIAQAQKQVPNYFLASASQNLGLVATSTFPNIKLAPGEVLNSQGVSYTLPGGQMQNAPTITKQMQANKWLAVDSVQDVNHTILKISNGSSKLLIELQQQGSGAQATTLVTIFPIGQKTLSMPQNSKSP